MRLSGRVRGGGVFSGGRFVAAVVARGDTVRRLRPRRDRERPRLGVASNGSGEGWLVLGNGSVALLLPLGLVWNGLSPALGCGRVI